MLPRPTCRYRHRYRHLWRHRLRRPCRAAGSLHDTDGAAGAAKGAGIGAGIYKSAEEAFRTLKTLATIEPKHQDEYRAAYERWKELVQKDKK